MVASSGFGLKKRVKSKRGGKSKSSSPRSGSHQKVQPSPTSDPKNGSESSGDDMPHHDKKDYDSSATESESGLKNDLPYNLQTGLDTVLFLWKLSTKFFLMIYPLKFWLCVKQMLN